ncbi:MAG TPA: hypothetical protein VKR99_00640, partial [Candidatus Eremiobacteraceae bacterium]|nr:hypothetical protein [Candidatus Eremiobacteraceae bacterium]
IGDQLHWGWLQGVDLNAYRFMIYGLILVLVMLFRPEGLIPSATRRAELRANHDEASGITGGDVPATAEHLG